MGTQYRTHTFLVLIIGEYARLIRWDRSGAVVTDRIEYNKTSELFDFFMRYNLADSEVRGHDGTVGTPTAGGLELALKNSDFVDVDDMAKTSFLAISIPIHDRTNPNRYIIPAPVVRAEIPVGRWTRASKAYDVRGQKVVFLKDSWRMVIKDILPEREVYQILHKNSVPNIPRCVHAGDVSDDYGEYHQTHTQRFATATWNEDSPRHFILHQHHRLILTPIGRKLEKFRTSREMVAAVYSALVGKLTSC